MKAGFGIGDSGLDFDGSAAIEGVRFAVEDGDGGGIEDLGDALGGLRSDGAGGVVEKDGAAEGVEPFRFLLAPLGFGGLFLGAVGEVAGDETGQYEGEESHPIFRIGDGELADRRQEIVVIRERGTDGNDDGRNKATGCGGGEHDDEEEESDSGRVDGDESRKEEGYGGDAEDSACESD